LGHLLRFLLEVKWFRVHKLLCKKVLGEWGRGRGEGGGALRYISDGKVQNPFLVLKFAIWTFCGD